MNVDNYSDTETNSSDSETCIKLMRSKQKQSKSNHSFQAIDEHESIITTTTPIADKNRTNQDICSNDNALECDFFTKQAKLQIETRMALSQAKVMAKMHMNVSIIKFQ